MEENLKISILEKQILKCLFDNPDLLDDKSIDCFISPHAQEFYVDLFRLRNEHKSIIAENIVTLDNEFVNSDVVNAVLNVNSNVDEFDYYLEKLEAKSLIEEFKSDTLGDLNDAKDDFEKLSKIRSRIDALEEKKQSDDYLSFTDLIDEYKGEISKRSSGLKVSTGDNYLDKLIPNLQAGLGFIVGMSGSMKSTYIIKILRNRITKRLPTCAINTELTHATYMDTMMSTLIDENYTDLTEYDENTDWNNIYSKLTDLERHYAKRNDRFRFYPNNTVSISEIETFCIKCRKEFKLEKDELLFCTIDLTLMISDMNISGTSRADAVTQGINRLNDIALANNIFFLGTIQTKKMASVPNIKHINDLQKFKIDVSMIKESNSILERGRVILAIHNPKYIVNQNPCPLTVKNMVTPVLELTVLKNSWSDTMGQSIYYYIDDVHKNLTNYALKEGETPNYIKEDESNADSNNDENDVIKRIEQEITDD